MNGSGEPRSEGVGEEEGRGHGRRLPLPGMAEGSQESDEDASETIADVAVPATDGPLQRLIPQGGAGVPLAAAAADVAAHGSRYTARTQMSTVLAYHLIERDDVIPDLLLDEFHRLLDRPRGSLYVDPGPVLASWLRTGGRPSTASTSEPAAVVHPLGVWFFDDVEGLVTSVTTIAAMMTSDAPSITTAGIAAGAVAAASHMMTGRDLVLGAAEVGAAVVERLEQQDRLHELAAARSIPAAMDDVKRAVGSTHLEIESLLARAGVPDSVLPVLEGIVAASAPLDPIERIEVGVDLGSDAAVVVGAMVGGQTGLRRWPWRVANETWFAEIGRRMEAGTREIGDLPIPFAVEERMRAVTASESEPP